MILSLFWAIWQIWRYKTEFKKRIEQEYEIYKAQLVNKTTVTLDMIEKNEKEYKKDFKKTIWKERLYFWFVILFSFALAVMFLTSMILL